MRGSIRVGNMRKGSGTLPLDGEVVYRFDRVNVILGNFHVLQNASDDDERARVIDVYRKDLEFDFMSGGPMSDEIEVLADRVISGERIVGMCWCSPRPCHGDFIVKEVLRVVKFKLAEVVDN